MTTDGEAERWLASGAAWLTGRPDGPPLGPPAALVAGVDELAAGIAAATAAVGKPLEVDGLELLVERAALAGLRRGGTTSCGGASRLLVASGGETLALSLARADDWELLPALLGAPDPVEQGDWTEVARVAAGRSAATLLERAELLGLPAARVGEVRSGPATGSAGADRRVTAAADLLVADLSALWAGPLAASVLADAGARVVKVESVRRPDGARSGPRAVFDLLNAGKESVVLDHTNAVDREVLGQLVEQSDVVVTSARRRALVQLGLDPSAHPGTIWLSITGYGLASNRVAFGDDAAVAGGLVVTDGSGPCFCLDAVADPLAGMAGAQEVLRRLGDGRGGVVDVAMAAVAARFAGPTVPLPLDAKAPPPVARRHRGRARPLGADTDRVLDDLQIA